MDNARKKDLLREYREMPQRAGIVSVLCRPTGQRWIAPSRNLDKQQNGIWFQLRLNGHPNKDAQAAWNAHGEDAFAFEIVEEIADDNPLLIGELLKERDAHWRNALAAQKLMG
ncbi:MAG: GIY-YIG nuclease family protein [Rhizomicrobium sp.]